ncbi:CmpA/NrtA family ABC transporter substrate-binding protein [Desulfoluna spongiiphila]|uniref:NitT/TauT family transport system substrate-binding protein n=1 Tax=Desulfoluna spongiiphila TaxID=419481 RepID=A0A1G5HCT2_9BACT|nr:CmpA/NrtA family ABC transporter substrate-binding protein [Desulfoluna spongiiphila]SCY61563.1 NitT/TauT family transport system substrate-binding protein [Desulfoluna spongiiphila]VVS94632.1 nmt1-like family [Desulfoluna spongiiphila]
MNSRHLTRKMMKTAAATLLMALCIGSAVHAAQKKLPSLYMGYIFTTHHTPLMVAAIKGEAFKASGAYLAPMVPKQKYKLMAADGTPLAVINLIVSKNGSETATLFAMNRLDLGLASSTAFMSGIDKGTKVKILCPLHVDGLSMVFPKGRNIHGYDEVAAAIKASRLPFKIGYHSPTSAPRIVFEGAFRKAGFTTTGNPNDINADILMVDLKSTANLIPALVSGQVDCWVGPAPHPAVAAFREVGYVALNSRDLPPRGQWTDFPCCVMGASEELIATRPDVVQSITGLMTAASNWSNAKKAETAEISATWIGVPAPAVEKSSIIYTTDPTKNWLKGEAIFLSMLNSMNKFSGVLKGTDLKTAAPILYDFSFIEKNLVH